MLSSSCLCFFSLYLPLPYLPSHFPSLILLFFCLLIVFFSSLLLALYPFSLPLLAFLWTHQQVLENISAIECSRSLWDQGSKKTTVSGLIDKDINVHLSVDFHIPDSILTIPKQMRMKLHVNGLWPRRQNEAEQNYPTEKTGTEWIWAVWSNLQVRHY